jgi:hypothetical protein
MGVDEADRHEIRVRNGVCVSDGERVLVDGLDGAPDVDDLVARGQELVGQLGQVERNAGAGGRVGLVDVYAVDGTAKWVGGTGGLAGGGTGVLGSAPNGVVEDEDAGCSGAGRLVRMSGKIDKGRSTRLSGVARSPDSTGP